MLSVAKVRILFRVALKIVKKKHFPGKLFGWREEKVYFCSVLLQ